MHSSDQPPVGRPTVLYVGGMPRSGTTLLDLMLGQLPGHCDVGELFYLWQAGVQRNQLCACDKRFADCPFWSEVGRRAFGGWDAVDAQQMMALQSSVDTSRHIPQILLARFLPRFRRRLEEYTDLLLRVYSAVLAVSGEAVVVDSTKRPSTAFVLWRSSRIDLRLVHMLRDPRAVVYAWTKTVAVPQGAGPRDHLKLRSPWQIARRWVTVNLMIAALGRLGAPLVRLRYEDLVGDAADELRRVSALTVQETGTLGELRFLDGGELQTARSHTLVGGRVRMHAGSMRLRLDEEWRSRLSGRRRIFVSVVTWPTRRIFGYR